MKLRKILTVLFYVAIAAVATWALAFAMVKSHGVLNTFPEDCAAAGGVVVSNVCITRGSIVEVK